MRAQQTYSVLVVDDSDDDRLLLRHALDHFPRFKILHELENGRDVVAYLQGEFAYQDRKLYPLPDLILLDLKMPYMTGHEVLAWLRTNAFPTIIVIVLSSSILLQDVEASLAMGAHGYWSKAADPERQRLIIKEIQTILDGRPVSKPTLSERLLNKQRSLVN